LSKIVGGETTVNINGNGIGGRNQELALRFSNEAIKYEDLLRYVLFLSCGTDGIDGPTSSAGAIGGCRITTGTHNSIQLYSLFLAFSEGPATISVTFCTLKSYYVF
jgi:glycerate-2-kinase